MLKLSYETTIDFGSQGGYGGPPFCTNDLFKRLTLGALCNPAVM